MSTDFAVSPDPYASWLQVRDRERPLNAYQLLGLKPLEAEQAKIRAAITRQRSLLAARQDEADGELLRRVADELENAVATLLDPDRKLLLDASLKRQMNGRSSTPGQVRQSSNVPVSSMSGIITCKQCGAENAAQRRFCSGCGSGLFESCPKCQAEVAADEKFCGACGTNLHDTLREQEEHFELQLEQAWRLQRSLRFEEAAAALRQVAVIEDVRFERFAGQALEMLAEFATQRQRLEQDAQQEVEKARALLDGHAYDKTIEALEKIPEQLRAGTGNELLADARSKRAELLQVSAELREAIAQKRTFDLLPRIERLLALKPDHAQGRQLAEQLREQLCKRAAKKLLEHGYAEARQLLESIPPFVRNEDTEKLLDKARELDCLATDIEQSPLIDAALVPLAERLVKFSPTDQEAQRKLAELKQRRQGAPANPRLAFPVWSAAPQRTAVGLSIDLLGQLTGCEVAPEAKESLRENAGRFFVALGLALQARQCAAISLSLMPAQKQGLLGSLGVSLRKPQPKAAWGIDLSSAGVRAIKLAARSDHPPRIEAAVFLPHVRPLAGAQDEIAAREIMVSTLRDLRDKFPFSKDKRESVAVSLSGARTLGRFFSLPPVALKKVADLVQHEARHQIPIPLEDLYWDYALLGDPAQKGDGATAREVMVVAARDFHVKERLLLFAEAEIPVDAVAAEPVALHNALAHELLAAPNDSGKHVAVLDIGASGSNFLVSSNRGLWFRSSALGGNDATAALVNACQLTHTQAEELKHAPHKARRYYQVQDALQPHFARIASDIERSLNSFSKQFPDRRVERLFLAGGGALTHGLVRSLMHGL